MASLPPDLFDAFHRRVASFSRYPFEPESVPRRHRALAGASCKLCYSHFLPERARASSQKKANLVSRYKLNLRPARYNLWPYTFAHRSYLANLPAPSYLFAPLCSSPPPPSSSPTTAHSLDVIGSLGCVFKEGRGGWPHYPRRYIGRPPRARFEYHQTCRSHQ